VRRWLDRLLDPEARRAIDETLADGRVEAQASGSGWAGIRTAAAVARVVASSAFRDAMTIGFRGFARDVGLAVRRLRGARASTGYLIATLAAGLGVTVAIYAALYAMFLRPPAIPNLDRVVEVRHTVRNPSMSFPDFTDLRAMQRTFDRVAALTLWVGQITANGQSREVTGEAVTGEYFEVLGLQPVTGRLLRDTDDDRAAPPVAVVSDRLWARFFARDPGAIGHVVTLDDHPFAIVGVVSATYRGGHRSALSRPADVWFAQGGAFSLAGFARMVDRADRDQRRLIVKARLADGRTVESAAADVARIADALQTSAPIGRDSRNAFDRSRPWAVVPARTPSVFVYSEIRQTATMALAALGLLFLVVCSNLGHQVLARAAARRQDAAIRLALGASRWRLLRESTIEITLLVAPAAGAGLLIAHALLSRMRVLWPESNWLAALEPRLDAPVLLVAGALTAIALLICAVSAAWPSLRVSASPAALADGGRGAPRWRGRQWLIGAQVTVSVVFVLLAASLGREAARQARADVGIDLDRLAVLITRTTWQDDAARVQRVFGQVAGQLRKQADVESVAIASGAGYGRTQRTHAYLRLPGAREDDQIHAALLASTPEIFSTLGTPIVRGRGFDARENASSTPVVVLGRATAARLFGGADPIGRQILFRRQRSVQEHEQPPKTLMVIGVVDDRAVDEVRPIERAFLPLAQHHEPGLVLIARTSGDPAALVPALRETMRRADPAMAVVAADTALALAMPELLLQQVTAALAASLGGFALVLALTGLAGILANVVRRRTREIGVRLALGATGRQILAGVLDEGLRPVIGGLAAGSLSGWLTHLIARGAIGLPAIDLWAMAIVPVLMLLAGALACYLPARRAARVDPARALRDL
jgi:putative ABC transport system permease protein